MCKKLCSVVLSLLLVAGLAGSALASGFAIIEQSVSGLGNAFSGGAASAEDATTVFFNPAGMTLLEGQQVVAGAHVIIPSTKFTATTAHNTLEEQGIVPSGFGSLGSNNGGEGGVVGLVPNLYYTNKLNDKLSIGLGINAPFGLATKYDRGWVGRYHAVESDVMTININPAIAYKMTDKLSLAAGVSAQYIDVTLSSMVDGGLALFQASGGTAPLSIVSNTGYDVYAENNADDWGFGYNLGLLYQFDENTRMGLAYRSQIKHKVKGDVDFQIPTPAAALGTDSRFFDQAVNGSITLPAIASLSLYHQVNDRLALMGDISWTEWSSFDKLVINFETSRTNSPTTENWDDTWRYSVGATYQASEALKLRGGLAYDETPISDDYRTPRIPGEDRFWVTLGCGYQMTETLGLDFAYAHLFVKDSKMQKYATAGSEDASRGTVVGTFKNSVDIASVQLSYKF